MNAKQTITISCYGSARDVEAQTFNGTTAVHESYSFIGAKWTVTDIASGKSIVKHTDRNQAVCFAKVVSKFGFWSKIGGDKTKMAGHEIALVRQAFIDHLKYDPLGKGGKTHDII